MVDEINDAALKSLLQRYGTTRLDPAKELGQDVVDTTLEDNEETPFKRAVRITQRLSKVGAAQWNLYWVQQLEEACRQAIDDAIKDARLLNALDDYAYMAAANAVRAQLRKLFESLEPPQEVIDSEEFQELMELLWPRPKGKKKEQGFGKGSDLKGQVKQDLKLQQVQQALKKASEQAQERLKSRAGDHKGKEQFLSMDLEQLARFLRRQLKERKRKTGIQDDAALLKTEGLSGAEAEEVLELRSLMNLFSLRALETMRCIREEIAPEWAPEQQPWLVANADNHVFSIILAAIPEELFAQTQSYDEMQRLRRGEAVFTLRAQDKLTEEAGRGGSS